MACFDKTTFFLQTRCLAYDDDDIHCTQIAGAEGNRIQNMKGGTVTAQSPIWEANNNLSTYMLDALIGSFAELLTTPN